MYIYIYIYTHIHIHKYIYIYTKIAPEQKGIARSSLVSDAPRRAKRERDPRQVLSLDAPNIEPWFGSKETPDVSLCKCIPAARSSGLGPMFTTLSLGV